MTPIETSTPSSTTSPTSNFNSSMRFISSHILSASQNSAPSTILQSENQLGHSENGQKTGTNFLSHVKVSVAFTDSQSLFASLIVISDQLFHSNSFVPSTAFSSSLPYSFSGDLLTPFLAISIQPESLMAISDELYRSNCFVALSLEPNSLMTISDELSLSNSLVGLSLQLETFTARSDQALGSNSFVPLSVQLESLTARSDQALGSNSFVPLSVQLESLIAMSDELYRSNSFVSPSVLRESFIAISDQALRSNSFVPSGVFPSSLQCSYSAGLLTGSESTESQVIYRTEDLARSPVFATDPLFSFSRSIPVTWRRLLTKGERTNGFSHVNVATDLGGSSLITFSNQFNRTPTVRPDELNSAGDAMAAAGSGKVDATDLSIGGGVSGLVLALTAGVALFFLVRKKGRDQETELDLFDENASDLPDSITSLASIDHYLSQENPDQVRTGPSTSLSSLSHTEFLIRSSLHE
jgi:hypothetical protein